MITITRCPSCATHYQVATPDLQAAKGWLRCGQCGHVFDSTGLVLNWTSTAALTEEKPDPTLGLAARDDMVADPADRLVLDDLLKKEDQANHHHASAELDSFAQALSSFRPNLSEPMAESLRHHRELPRMSSWAIPFLAWTLFLVLLVQLVYSQRHAIVATWPDSGPFIQHVCQSFGCDVQHVRDARGMVIETSELSPLGDGHILRWTVRNTTDRNLATIAVEITLLDSAEKLVVRRAVLPAEAGAPQVLEPGQSWLGELYFAVDADRQFSAYRLVGFYP